MLHNNTIPLYTRNSTCDWLEGKNREGSRCKKKEGSMLNLIGERRRTGGLGFRFGCIKKQLFLNNDA